ncbi:MAG: hypothetical protein ABR500_16410 [Dermatophilaceae bacterium]
MNDTETMWLVVAGVLALAVILFVVYLVGTTARSRPDGGGKHRAPNKNRPHRDTFRTEEPEPEPLKQAAVIASDGDPALCSELTSQSTAAGWDEPLWLEVDGASTAADAARRALDAGVDVVCVRGDSAVARGVVSVLAGTETPVAFLPSPGRPGDDDTAPAEQSGPLALPSAGVAAAMTTALTGQNSRVDVGRARLAPPPPATQTDALEAPEPDGEEIVFLTSLVFGDIVSHEAPALSTRTVARGLVKGTSFTATVKPDDEEAVTRPARSVAFSTSPTAATSGRLDAYLHASHSFKGWTGVARAMMRKASRPTPLLVPLHSAAFTLTLDKGAEVTVDGLAIGPCHPGESTVSLDPLALVLRR